MSPRVTVGIPVYNGEEFLSETLASIQAQDFSDIEILISDNGSSDGTEAICRDAAALDGRIRYLRVAQNHGGAWNTNNLFMQAKAPLFKLTHYDDPCEPGLLSACISALDAAGETAVLAYPRVLEIDAAGRVIGARGDADMQLQVLDPAHRVHDLLSNIAEQVAFGVVRLDALRRTKGYQVSLANGFILLTELALMGPFVAVPEQLQYIRIHPDQHGGTRAGEYQWFVGGKSARRALPYVRANGPFYSAVWRSGLDLSDKFRVSDAIFRGWTVRKWRSYLSDIVHLPEDLGVRGGR